MSALPGVCILCPTYARVELLAELAECFRRQTYAGPKRLVILNDYGAQDIRCDVPGVVIYNYGGRYTTLGAKRSALLEFAYEPLVQWWDDDDIFLPHHIEASVARVTDEPATRVPYEYAEAADGGYEVVHAGGVRGITFKADRLRQIGIPLVDRGHWNLLIPTLVKRWCWFHGAHHSQATCPPSIIQRIHHGYPRQSTHTREAVTSAAAGRAYNGADPTGTVNLKPGWIKDYVEAVRNVARPEGTG